MTNDTQPSVKFEGEVDMKRRYTPMTNDTRPVAPVEGDYTIMPTKLAEALNALVPLADAACDYADQHCRAFPIATAPRDGATIEVWNDVVGRWFKVKFETRRQCWVNIMVSFDNDMHDDGAITHWRPLSPPPSNPPLPAVFVELGQALEKIKEGR